jgi:hypothetical protein
MTKIPLQQTVRRELTSSVGLLVYFVRAFKPQGVAPELPDPEYILIEWLEAKPPEKKLLRNSASRMISDIRDQFGPDRKIILQPSNFDTPEEMEQLEHYYQTCGFVYLPTSPSKFWMMWPDPCG